ncbi:alpha-E domain-containing protein [Falsiroseomonas bella]|uniref:Alpha-E domain-containing protein n=1 Tax=Falsiroseomonas bella TaxID=2184016 RepID=A0A317F9A1_9PROT|nr:alpha-E domain-containing protein [Falsiroseomonas bella]PWS34597.1 alpha-E domain-containing protein [Falsiroseomonas bella]
MLSRTADSLYWMGRYTERAGNIARGMQVALRMSGLAGSLGGAHDEWRNLLVAAGAEPGFKATGRAVAAEAVIGWLALDPDNPSSIANCIEAARGNGRAVRTALTVDMWEALNDTWREMRARSASAAGADALPAFLDWVRARTLLFNGAAADTMLRDEGWLFVHLGVMLERADNTARLLDAKHRALSGPNAEGGLAYAEWQALLRSVSALRAFQWLYHTRLEPRLIVELMLFRSELPRSLISCHRRVLHALESVADRTGGRRGDPQRIAAEINDALLKGRVEDVLSRGLHDWLTGQIDRNIELGNSIQSLYLNG